MERRRGRARWSRWFWFGPVVLAAILGGTWSIDAPCDFNAMCLCWVQDDAEDFTKMDISCTAVPFARFPDVSISYVAQLDVIGSGIQVFDDDALASASGVEALGLMSNQLLSVGDKSLHGVTDSLQSLDLSYNSLEEIPFSTFKVLKKLNWLNFHSNHLTTLDGDWGYITETLSTAFFGENSITDVPPIFASFKSLLWLNLDSNNIGQIPEASLPPNLHTLSLNTNLLKTFPSSLARLDKLSWVYLRGNVIKHLELPRFPSRNLELLDLSENMIESISYVGVETNETLYVRDLHLGGNRLAPMTRDLFQGLLITRLHLSSNNIRTMDDGVFSGLEESLEYLNLENNEIAEFPRSLTGLSRLAYLYLANNALRNLTNDDFREFSDSLKALSLASNNFESLPVDALRNCTNLLHLNLGYNKVHQISTGDLDWAENLEILLLRNNFLTQLKPNVFRGATKLKELSLSFNHLSDIADDAFKDTGESLEILELSFAFSTDAYPQRALRPLVNLHWIVLDNNNFHTIDTTAFYSFQRIHYINLESNRFHYLPDRIFLASVHGELRDIKLGYNFLETLPENTFHNLTQLRALDVTGNRLKYLAANTICDCPNLLTLSLANNRISRIDRDALSELYSLRFLHLEFNKLRMLDFEAFLNSGSQDFTLNVSYNSISSLNPSPTTLNLTRLDLSFNNLTQLLPDVFVNLPNLRSLSLEGNYISSIDPGTFALKRLDTLNLRDNHIETLRKQSFNGLESLQELDLSGNILSQFTIEQFRQLKNLRVLNLARNRLRSLPRDVFTGTKLEILDLSQNKFSSVPSSSFLEVGYTLRSIDLSQNVLDHLDSSSFPTSQLTYLNVAQNKIQLLPDNSFVSLSKLLALNISHNGIRANFKELFHYLPEIKQLDLTGCHLKSIPHIITFSLNYLDVSRNGIDAIHEGDLQYIATLKALQLANNSLTMLDGLKLISLRELDVSGNPIKELRSETFAGMPRLERLNIRDLNKTQNVAKNTIRPLAFLRHLKTQTWPDEPDFELREFLKGLPLRSVEIQMVERELTDQLHYAFTKQLRELTITGQNLNFIASDAFSTIEGAELVLRIRNTQVQRLQSDIFLSLTKHLSQLTLDLRNNLINELSPSAIYGNSSWETVGTNMVAGGLQLSGNPLECDCEIAWLSLWLRRWLRESRQIHTASQSDAQQLRTMAGRAVCTETTHLYSSDRALLSLGTPSTACQASALSNANRYFRYTPISIASVGIMALLLLIR